MVPTMPPNPGPPSQLGRWLVLIIPVVGLFAAFANDPQARMVSSALALVACLLVLPCWERIRHHGRGDWISVTLALGGASALMCAGFVAWRSGDAVSKVPDLADVPIRSARELPPREGVEGEDAVLRVGSTKDFFVASSPISVHLDEIEGDSANLRVYTRDAGMCAGPKEVFEGFVVFVPTSDPIDVLQARVSLRVSVQATSPTTTRVRVERLHGYSLTGGDGICGGYPSN
jgi:hypothetical protein